MKIEFKLLQNKNVKLEGIENTDLTKKILELVENTIEGKVTSKSWLKIADVSENTKEIVENNFDIDIEIVKLLSEPNIFNCAGFASTGTKEKVHPTQKPLELIQKIVEISSNENDLVLDPFTGSGTPAIACKKLKRNFIGFELDSTNFDMIAKRLDSNNKMIRKINILDGIETTKENELGRLTSMELKLLQ